MNEPLECTRSAFTTEHMYEDERKSSLIIHRLPGQCSASSQALAVENSIGLLSFLTDNHLVVLKPPAAGSFPRLVDRVKGHYRGLLSLNKCNVRHDTSFNDLLKPNHKCASSKCPLGGHRRPVGVFSAVVDASINGEILGRNWRATDTKTMENVPADDVRANINGNSPNDDSSTAAKSPSRRSRSLYNNSEGKKSKPIKKKSAAADVAENVPESLERTSRRSNVGRRLIKTSESYSPSTSDSDESAPSAASDLSSAESIDPDSMEEIPKKSAALKGKRRGQQKKRSTRAVAVEKADVFPAQRKVSLKESDLPEVPENEAFKTRFKAIRQSLAGQEASYIGFLSPLYERHANKKFTATTWLAPLYTEHRVWHWFLVATTDGVIQIRSLPLESEFLLAPDLEEQAPPVVADLSSYLAQLVGRDANDELVIWSIGGRDGTTTAVSASSDVPVIKLQPAANRVVPLSSVLRQSGFFTTCFSSHAAPNSLLLSDETGTSGTVLCTVHREVVVLWWAGIAESRSSFLPEVRPIVALQADAASGDRLSDVKLSPLVPTGPASLRLALYAATGLGKFFSCSLKLSWCENRCFCVVIESLEQLYGSIGIFHPAGPVAVTEPLSPGLLSTPLSPGTGVASYLRPFRCEAAVDDNYYSPSAADWLVAVGLGSRLGVLRGSCRSNGINHSDMVFCESPISKIKNIAVGAGPLFQASPHVLDSPMIVAGTILVSTVKGEVSVFSLQTPFPCPPPNERTLFGTNNSNLQAATVRIKQEHGVANNREILFLDYTLTGMLTLDMGPSTTILGTFTKRINEAARDGNLRQQQHERYGRVETELVDLTTLPKSLDARVKGAESESRGFELANGSGVFFSAANFVAPETFLVATAVAQETVPENACIARIVITSLLNVHFAQLVSDLSVIHRGVGKNPAGYTFVPRLCVPDDLKVAIHGIAGPVTDLLALAGDSIGPADSSDWETPIVDVVTTTLAKAVGNSLRHIFNAFRKDESTKILLEVTQQAWLNDIVPDAVKAIKILTKRGWHPELSESAVASIGALSAILEHLSLEAAKIVTAILTFQPALFEFVRDLVTLNLLRVPVFLLALLSSDSTAPLVPPNLLSAKYPAVLQQTLARLCRKSSPETITPKPLPCPLCAGTSKIAGTALICEANQHVVTLCCATGEPVMGLKAKACIACGAVFDCGRIMARYTDSDQFRFLDTVFGDACEACALCASYNPLLKVPLVSNEAQSNIERQSILRDSG